MFNFFKRMKNKKAKAQDGARKKNNTSQKNPAREKHIEAVMEATGWSREQTIETIKEAKARLGISYKDYSRNAFYNIPIEEQKAKYDEVLERKERRRIKNEESIAGVMEATGWSREQTIETLKEAKARLGISYKDYNRNAFYNIPIEEQKAKYVKLLEDKERKRIQNEKSIASVMEATGWSREQTIETLKEAKARLGISYGDYRRNAFYNIPVEEQKAKYDEVLERKERKRINTEKRSEKFITGVMKETGWDHDYTEAKILEARERTGCTYKEYLIYKFYELTPEEQDDVFIIKHSRKITAKYDVDKEFTDMLCNKKATNIYFSKYLRRPWCVNTQITLEEFKEKFANSKRVIYKPLGGNRGRGVEAFDIDSENVEMVYNTVVTYPAGVVEQYVVQHPAVSSINPDSVNTLRIVTISSNTKPVTAEGKLKDFAYAALRIGGSGSIVDNFHSGGMVAAVDLETGELVTDAADENGRVFEKHPTTGTAIKGFKIPYFKEALELVDEAITEKKIEGYLGWDIAITETGPVLIEVNVVPGVVLLSMPYAAEKKGMKYVMEKYI